MTVHYDRIVTRDRDPWLFVLFLGAKSLDLWRYAAVQRIAKLQKNPNIIIWRATNHVLITENNCLACNKPRVNYRK